MTIDAVLWKSYLSPRKEYQVKIRVTVDRKQHYFGTGEWMRASVWKALNGQPRGKNRETKDRIDALVEKAKSFAATPFNPDAFRLRFTGKGGTGFLSEFAHVIEQRRKNGQVGTAMAYENARKALATYLEDTDVRATQVNEELLNGFVRWLRYTRECSGATQGMYLRAVQVCYTGIKGLPPFPKVKVIKTITKPRALKLDELKKLIGDKTLNKRAKDFWLFSFHTGGMNAYDIAKLKYTDITGDRLTYHRQKTKNTSAGVIEVHLTDQVRKTIIKYGTRNKSGYVFDILKPGMTAEEEKKAVNAFSTNLNHRLKGGKIKGLFMYQARHTFAALQMRNDTPLKAIQEMLGHTSPVMTQRYLGTLDYEEKKSYFEKTASL